MPSFVRLDEARRLIDDGAHVLEVLEKDEYERAHLPGAVNLPLWEFDEQRIAALGFDRDAPVLVYCYDTQ